MARIKIKDLPVIEDLPPEEQKGIFGGGTLGGDGGQDPLQGSGTVLVPPGQTTSTVTTLVNQAMGQH